MTMTYEAYLDEVTTLITEKFGVDDDEAIRLVMAAQAADFFCGHDEQPAMRTPDRAHQDARSIFRMKDRLAEGALPKLDS